MTAVSAEESACEHSHFSEYPCEERKLEDGAHHQQDSEEVVHIRVERHHGAYGFAQAIVGKETHGEGEYEIVSDGHAEVEHYVAEYECLGDAAALMLV